MPGLMWPNTSPGCVQCRNGVLKGPYVYGYQLSKLIMKSFKTYIDEVAIENEASNPIYKPTKVFKPLRPRLKLSKLKLKLLSI